MSIVINGKKYVAAYLNGKRYDKGYFNGKLVLVTPDYNNYLMAADDVHFRVNEADLLAFDIVPQVQNNLPQLLGSEPFAISVDIHRDLIGKGLCYLFDWAGMIDCKSQNETLAFRFNWEEKPEWKFIPKAAIKEGWNKVRLDSDGVKITFKVNDYSAVLLDGGLQQELLSIVNNGLVKNGPTLIGSDSGSAYARTKDVINFGSYNAWRVEVKYTHKDGGGDYPSIFGPYSGSVRNCPELEFKVEETNHLYVNLAFAASTATSYYVEEYLVSGRTYWFVVEFTGTQYLLKVSEDKKTWREHILLDSTSKVYKTTSGSNLQMTILNSRISDAYRNSVGSVDLTEIRIYVDSGNGLQSIGTEVVYPFQYPTLTAGTLTVKQDWDKLNNFKAVTTGE